MEDTYQTKRHKNIYAVGIGTAVQVPWQTAHAVGVPKTGFAAETMARVAAANIAAQIRGEEPARREGFGEIPAVCIMDAGNNGVVILADHMLPPRKHGVVIPGPQSHAGLSCMEEPLYYHYTQTSPCVRCWRRPAPDAGRLPRPAGRSVRA